MRGGENQRRGRRLRPREPRTQLRDKGRVHPDQVERQPEDPCGIGLERERPHSRRIVNTDGRIEPESIGIPPEDIRDPGPARRAAVARQRHPGGKLDDERRRPRRQGQNGSGEKRHRHEESAGGEADVHALHRSATRSTSSGRGGPPSLSRRSASQQRASRAGTAGAAWRRAWPERMARIRSGSSPPARRRSRSGRATVASFCLDRARQLEHLARPVLAHHRAHLGHARRGDSPLLHQWPP